MLKRIEEIDIEKLKKGCILASVVHAIMLSKYPELSNEYSWDNMNYSVQDSMGTKTTITFLDNKVVAAFQKYQSIDSLNYNKHSIEKIFKYADQSIINIAETETLSYLLEDLDGTVLPYISTAFWYQDKSVFSNDNYENLIEKGMDIIEIQLLDIENGLKAWEDYYEMNEIEINLSKRLFNKRISHDKKIILTKEETDILFELAGENIDECEESLNEISMYLFKE